MSDIARFINKCEICGRKFESYSRKKRSFRRFCDDCNYNRQRDKWRKHDESYYALPKQGPSKAA